MISQELVNPPQDVTAALVSLQQACSGWQPVAVRHDGVPSIVPAEKTQTTATEAQACKFVQNPADYMLHSFYVVGTTLIPLLIVVVFVGWAVRLHRLPHAVANLARNTFRRGKPA